MCPPNPDGLALDLFQLSSFKWLRFLHPGVTMLLNIAMSGRLCSTSVKTVVIMMCSGQSRPLSSVLGGYTWHNNRAPWHFKAPNGIACWFQYRFWRDIVQRATGRECVGGMVEAKHFDYIDSITSFIGVIVHRLCGKESNDPLKEVFPIYVDIVRKLC